jgi:hypothetical protein
MITSSRRHGSVGEMYANQLDAVRLLIALNCAHMTRLTGTSCHFMVVSSSLERLGEVEADVSSAKKM